MEQRNENHLMFWKSKNSRCFIGIKSFLLDYEDNRKTFNVFERWLKNLNKKNENRKA